MKKDVRTATEVDAFVGAQLKTLRKSAELSQTELANQIGVTFQQVQKYERGSNRIGASRLWGLCKVFDVTPDRFFEGVEEHLANTGTPEHANGNASPPSRVSL
jgi:transcriptional regulator with XRE-family HTH domain